MPGGYILSWIYIWVPKLTDHKHHHHVLYAFGLIYMCIKLNGLLRILLPSLLIFHNCGLMYRLYMFLEDCLSLEKIIIILRSIVANLSTWFCVGDFCKNTCWSTGHYQLFALVLITCCGMPLLLLKGGSKILRNQSSQYYFRSALFIFDFDTFHM